MLSALQCYTKWIESPTRMMERLAHDVETQRLLFEEKIASGPAKNANDGETIQKILKNCTPEEQYERDVAMWYGYCKDGSKGAQLALRIFGMMSTFGVLCKRKGGAWESANVLGVPVASLLSHGGRIVFLLPMSNSASRNIYSKAKALVKGVTVDPIVAIGNRGTYHTMPGWVAVVTRPTGLASVMAVLSTGHKVYDAGDDRFWSWFADGDVHDRGVATHSTVAQDFGDAPPLGFNRALWFTEEKAAKTVGGVLSNLRDAVMGRHHYKNVALGGVGNRNPFSGVKIQKDGSHGHLYINYRSPGYKTFGCLMLGVEGSAPGMSNQYGKVHDAKATKGEWSATGGKKWENLIDLAESASNEDVTTWVCDLSSLNTTAAYGAVKAANFGIDDLSRMPQGVTVADWTEVLKRM
jgi:hypothetical protein